jgi:predicted alpha/beta superfamily hydrolase
MKRSIRSIECARLGRTGTIALLAVVSACTSARARGRAEPSSSGAVAVYGSRAADGLVELDTRPARLAIGETFTLDSRVLGETRRINIYAPPAYADSAVRLPVLYMPDGGMAEDFLHVAGLVQVLTGNGSMRPFVLVGIENTERRRDMTGPTDNADDRKIAPRVGGSAAFRTFIRTELMPWVNAHYRTTGEDAIVGESLAGLFVVETFVLEPELFDTYLAFDPSLWWNDAKLIADAERALRGPRPTARALYFASSDEKGIVEDAARLASVLERNPSPGLSWHYEPMPEETHATIYHPAALRAFRAVLGPAK